MSSTKQFINLYIDSFKNLPNASWIILAAIFINAVGQMFLFFLALYLSSYDLSPTVISYIIASYSLGSLLGSYLGGEISEKLGLKTLISSLLASSILLILIAVTESFIVKGVLVACLGITHNIFKPASIFMLLYFTESNDQARLLGLRRVMVNLGASIAAVLGGYLSTINYNYIFICESVISLAASVILLYNYPGIMKNFALITRCDEEGVENKSWNIAAAAILYFIFFLNILVFAQLFTSYPLYLKAYYAIDTLTFAKLFTVNSVIIFLIEVPLLNFVKNKNQNKLLMLGTILMCNGLAILPLSNHLLLAYFSVIIWTLGEILFFPSILNMILSTTKQKRGRAIGLYQLVYCTGMLIGPVLCAAIYDINNGAILWGACSVISALSCLLIPFITTIPNSLKSQKNLL